ncbi:hypothetical protein GINT2_000565 [Glugoides intestinalis]
MESGSQCSICFAEYTLNGNHRPISLKCGHLFGSECIEKWLFVYKRSYCPICSAQFRKTQLRPIFASKIEAIDDKREQEMIEKYIQEKDKRVSLEREIAQLKSQIEIMKMNVKQEDTTSKDLEHRIHMQFLGYFKIHCFPDGTVLAFDSVTNLLVIACSKTGNLFKYKFPNFSTYSSIKLEGKVRCLEISPFGDSMCLIGHGNTASIVDLLSNDVLRSFEFESSVSAVSFCDTDRVYFFVADMAGYFYTCSIVSNSIEKTKVCNENIHSIAFFDDLIYVASIFGIFEKTIDEEEFTKLYSSSSDICTSLNSGWSTGLAIFRNQNYTVSRLFVGYNEFNSSLEIKQFSRHNDKVFNGYVCITNDAKNTIEVLDLYTLTSVYSYSFPERVIGFCGDSDTLIVLTTRGFYVYE